MPIPRYLEDVGAFDPDVIKAMSAALEKACAVLHIGNQILDREAIATRVIDLARNGIVDANTLAQRVIAETEAMSALTNRTAIRYTKT